MSSQKKNFSYFSQNNEWKWVINILGRGRGDTPSFDINCAVIVRALHYLLCARSGKSGSIFFRSHSAKSFLYELKSKIPSSPKNLQSFNFFFLKYFLNF